MKKKQLTKDEVNRLLRKEIDTIEEQLLRIKESTIKIIEASLDMAKDTVLDSLKAENEVWP